MCSRHATLMLAAVMTVGICIHAFAQTPSQTKTAGPAPAPANAAGAKPDFSGIWHALGTPLDYNNLKGPGIAAGKSKTWFGKDFSGGGYGFVDSKMEPPSMLPWAEARYKATREGSYEYLQVLKDLEPFLNCLPSSLPWVYDRGDPFEIVQTADKVVMLFENDGHWRQIFLDGRKNPEGPPDTFMGYSVGRWEGDTLVVETIGLSDLAWMDRLGHPHSDALRIEERIRRVSANRMDIDFLFDDPKTYTKPWKGKKVFVSGKDDVIESFSCEEKWRNEYPDKVRKELGEIKP